MARALREKLLEHDLYLFQLDAVLREWLDAAGRPKPRVAPDDDTNAVTIFPDVIVHKQGKNSPTNLLALEAKKAGARGQALDLAKLGALRREPYGYR